MPLFAVAVASAAGMALEVAFGRSAGPFLGTSTEVWAAIIAVTLAALALGAWLGGRAADGHDPRASLAGALGLAALFAGFAAIGRDTMSDLGLTIAAISGSLFLGATVSALAVLAPAVTAIGAVSPIAARLTLLSLGTTGRTMGRLGVAGAGGSVVGTVAAGAFTLPYLGTAKTFALVAVALFVAAAVATRGLKPAARWLVLCLAIAGAAIAAGATFVPPRGNVVVDADTSYGRALLVRGRRADGRETLSVKTDPFGTQCAGYVDEPPNAAASSLPFAYTRWLGLAADLSGADGAPVLVIGGCNLSFPRHLAARGESVEVIEIDPGMTQIARRFFGAPEDSPTLRVTHGDARVIIAAATATYRAAALDAFGSFSAVPYHLATAEFFTSLRGRLAPEAALAVNVIGAREGESAAVTAAILASARSAFPRAEILYDGRAPADATQNLLLLAWNGAGPDDQTLADAGARHGLTVSSDDELARLPEEPALTDDLAPIERLTVALRRERLGEIREGLGF